MTALFGNPSPTQSPKTKEWTADRKWESTNMVVARNLPFGIKKLYVHKKAEPYLREALERAEDLLPDWKPAKIGSFSVRRQRHDENLPWSDHAYGIAIDVAADERGFRRKDARLPPEFVRAMKSVGYAWGGDWRSKDEMHFSLRF